MAGELAPAPEVEDEPIATMVSGWPPAIFCSVRLSGMSSRTSSAGPTQAGGCGAGCVCAKATVAAAVATVNAATHATRCRCRRMALAPRPAQLRHSIDAEFLEFDPTHGAAGLVATNTIKLTSKASTRNSASMLCRSWAGRGANAIRLHLHLVACVAATQH